MLAVLEAILRDKKSLKGALFAAASGAAFLCASNAVADDSLISDDVKIEAAQIEALEQDATITDAAGTPILVEPAEANSSKFSWFLTAFIVGGLAALARIFGATRAMKFASDAAPVVAKATRDVAQGSINAAKAIGSATLAPFKLMMVLVSLAVFAFAGVGFYDLEWLGGLAVGAGSIGVVALSYMRAKNLTKLVPAALRSSKAK